MHNRINICSDPCFHSLVGICNDTINRAVNKTAEQSPTYKDHPASLAVAGSRDGAKIPAFPNRDGQFSHTQTGSPQWWMVDLSKVFYVYRVRLWNRLGYGKLHVHVRWEVFAYKFFT